MADISETLKHNISVIREQMDEAARQSGRTPSDITLCAASKTRTVEEILASAAYAIDCFGENHAQELERNYDAGAYAGKPGHFIGHLQTNKVKKVVGRAALIQSVDSEKVADAIDACASKLGIVQDILLEINVGGEESKSGTTFDGCRALLDYTAAKTNLSVCGLMTIPPVCGSEDEARRWFARMRSFFDEMQSRNGGNTNLAILSMGMSADFAAAILEGSTMVRVGSAIYGHRFYPNKTI